MRADAQPHGAPAPPADTFNPADLRPDVSLCVADDIGVFQPGRCARSSEHQRDQVLALAMEPYDQLMVDVRSVGRSTWERGDTLERRASATTSVEVVVGGAGNLLVNKVTHTLQTGDLFLLHPGEHHRYSATAAHPFEKLYIDFWPNDQRIATVMRGLGLATVAHVRLSETLLAQFKVLHDVVWSLAQRKSAGFRRRASAKVYDFLVQLSCHVHPTLQGAPLPAQLCHALHYALAHRRQAISVTTLARHAGYSVGHLNRLFKQHLGMTAHEWFEKVKIRDAAFMLRETNLPVYEVAARVGYEDPYYFSLAFKRVAGVSPRAMRDLFRAQNRRSRPASRRRAGRQRARAGADVRRRAERSGR